MSEDILKDENNKKYILSVKNRRNDIYNLYKTQMDMFWSESEICFDWDYEAFKKLKKEEQFYIKNVIAFFSSSDLLVIDNINVNFINEIQYPEAILFMTAQAMFETIHTTVYNKMLEVIIKDQYELEFLLNSINENEIINIKCIWYQTYFNNEIWFVKRLVAQIVVELVFFCSSFAAIYYLKSRNIGMHGLCFWNELIARDESIHVNFYILIYTKYIKNKLSYEDVIKIFDWGVSIEKEFVKNALPVNLIGLNADLMCEYVEFIANRGLYNMGYPKYYKNAKNPFPFMDMINLEGKANFFEKKVSNYKRANINETKFSMTDDF